MNFLYSVEEQGFSIQFREGGQINLISIDGKSELQIMQLLNPVIGDFNFNFFKELATRIIHIIKNLEVQKLPNNVAYLSSKLFEWATITWKKLDLTNSRYLWAQIHKIISETEKENSAKFHKGTLYYFHAVDYLRIGEHEVGIGLLYEALLEDQRLEDNGGIPVKDQPAYKTLTFSNSRDNFLAKYVEIFRTDIVRIIQELNTNHQMKLELDMIRSTLLSNKDLQYCWYALISLVLGLHEWTNLVIQNSFSALVFQRWIREITLIIEHVLAVYTSKRDIQTPLWGLSKDFLIERWISKNVITDYDSEEKISEEIRSKLERLKQIEEDNLANNLVATIRRLCSPSYGESREWKERKIDQSMNYEFKTTPSEDVSLLLLPALLRNWSSHRLETSKSLLENWEKILRRIFFALFFTIIN